MLHVQIFVHNTESVLGKQFRIQGGNVLVCGCVAASGTDRGMYFTKFQLISQNQSRTVSRRASPTMISTISLNTTLEIQAKTLKTADTPLT